MLEIKDAVEGTKTATSVSSIGPENMHTPPPASGSPVLNRLGSGSRPVAISPGQPTHSLYSNVHNNSSNVSISHLYESTIRGSLDQDSQQYPRPFRQVDDLAGSAAVTPVALQPSLHQSRPSLDALEQLDSGHGQGQSQGQAEYFAQPTRPSGSPRPISDPDLKPLLGRPPAQVLIETTEYNPKIPNIAPRQSSIAYAVNALRPNLNVPPAIVPRQSSRDYSTAHGLNAPHSGRGMSPVSPPSPGGFNYPSPYRGQESPVVSKNGPSLNERRNNNSLPHIQTQSLADAQAVTQHTGQRPPFDPDQGSTVSGPHSDATVVGGTLGFGRRPSHKRNHSSADVIQYPPAPAATPKVEYTDDMINWTNGRRPARRFVERSLNALLFPSLQHHSPRASR